MNLHIYVFLVLVLSCVLFANGKLNFGPWFPATEGEPWPLPWIKNTSNESLFLHPINFVIKVSCNKNIILKIIIFEKQFLIINKLITEKLKERNSIMNYDIFAD